MYPEFIAIYIGMAIIIAMLAVILVLLFRSNGTKGISKPTTNSNMNFHNATNNSVNTSSGNIVFCKKCATQFDSSQHVCPKCGTPR